MTDTNSNLDKIGIEPPTNRSISPAKMIMEEYSPRNSKAKRKEPYSVLYPETNSDSDSGKSKGTRAVSIIPNTIKYTNSQAYRIRGV